MREKVPVVVTIRGAQPQMSEEIIETRAAGTLTKVGTTYVVEYEENLPAENGKVLAGRATMMLHPDHATLMRTGAIVCEMAFYPSEVRTAPYQNPVGTMEMRIQTKEYEMTALEEELSVRIRYDLWFDEIYICEHILHMQIKAIG
ncbi:MAG: DUF1934 domain-containing protein [Lachnospiraceae bacterium]|nr:DUF1934 domain-containing protein [Lachnospiraceae bacterium]